MTKPSKTEQELRDIIQEAWCDGDGNPEDKFGDFLKRASGKIIEAGYVKVDKLDHIIKKPETKEVPPEIERYNDSLMSEPEYEPETLTDFKKCLAEWLETNRLRIWVGVKMEHDLTQYLVDYGIMIPTSAGLMKPRGLLKCP